ncbi:MAG: response regulator [Chloroflexota bacterium]
MVDQQRRKVLIAEDEPDIRELVKLTLTFHGFDVVAAEDGMRAVELAQADVYDLILMDVLMPRMTGYEACREIKKIDRFKHIPVVFLSAKGQESEVKEGLSAGAVAYMLKPFDADELIETLNAVLEE